MGLLNLRSFKKVHLDWLKKKLKKETDPDIEVYLATTISSIEGEIYERSDYQYNFNEEKFKDLKPIGEILDLTEKQIQLLSYFFTNKTCIASRLASESGLDRAFVYRTLNTYVDMGLLGRTEVGVCNYYLVDRVNPLRNVIDLKKKHLKLLKYYDKVIVK